MFSTTSRPQSASKGRSFDPDSNKKGYTCALYQDYLVLLGTNPSGPPECNLCVFNLKHQKAEEEGPERIPAPFLPSSACAYVHEGMSIIYCHGEIAQGFGANGASRSDPEYRCTGLILQMRREEDGLRYDFRPAMPGPGTPSSICYMSEGKIFLYDPSNENANFGSLRWCSILGGGANWNRPRANHNNMRLNEPSHNAIFINDVLYLFAGNTDVLSQALEEGESLIEDVYTLDLKNGKSSNWERISPSGGVPGTLSHISLAEANGVVYVFGSSEGKLVLWAYNISEKEWKQVKDVKTVTAGPNQKAVIYQEQLLIINWGYSRDSVDIQYFGLDDLKFVEPSPSGKDLCKDQAENFIQDTKNLYNGRLFPDVVFEVEGEQIPAHKAILAHRSDYFMKMFMSGMSESHSAKISIPHMKAHVFKALLQYVYCNEVELDEQLALDLIPTVDEYVMKGLKGLCEKYLCKQLRKDNVVNMLIVADRHEIDELKKACFKFILKNLGNIDENEEMNKLSKSLFIELLKFSTAPQTGKKDKPSDKEYSYQQDKRATPKKATSSSLFGSKASTSYGIDGGGGLFGNR